MPRLLIATTVSRTLDAFLLPYASHFRRLGWIVDGLAAGALTPESAAHFDHVFEAPWSRHPLAPANLIVAPDRLHALQRSRHYDIIHAHTPVAGFVTRYALRQLRRQGSPLIVYTAHGFHFHRNGHPLLNRIFETLERTAGPWTDGLVVLNEEDQRAAERFGSVPASRIFSMPGIGIDLSHYARSATWEADVASVRAELRVPLHVPYFLVAAEFTRNKRHSDIVRALATLQSRTRPDASQRAHLVLAGSGPEESRIRRLVHNLNLSACVHFAGFRKDVRTLMTGAAAVVLASAREGLPRCLLEAMALGVPVIASDARGCTDLTSGGRGLRFPIGDVRLLAQRLAEVLDAPAIAARCVSMARMAISQYSTTAIAEHHEALYERLLNSRRAHRTGP